MRQTMRLLSLIVTAAIVSGCGEDEVSTSSAAACAEKAPRLLQTCVAEVNAAWQSCFADDAGPCSRDDADTNKALATLEQGVRAACGDGDFSGLTLEGIVERWRYACRSEADSLAWRSFGGPQAAVFVGFSQPAQDCELAAHRVASGFMEAELAAYNDCLANPSCDAADNSARSQRFTQALADIDAGCERELSDLVAIDPPTFLERAGQQAECLAAIAHAEPRFALGCGGGNAVAQPPRGAYQRIVLDAATVGPRFASTCGDGSPYAFDIRLAPAGSRLDRVVIGLQGGGVCFFDEDCSARFRVAPGLFTAADDQPPFTGIFSNNPDDSAFATWTKVYLPYCTQDVFIGGGVVQDFEAIDLHRNGAINLRNSLRIVRDILWQAMDAEGGAGYRAGELIALFGGWSAGGYGTMYNYHWVLDDLLWQRTAAFPDAGLGFDNGGIGVRALGITLLPVWNAQPFLPPYCFAGRCAVGPTNFAAISPRLKQVPEQQYLIVSNQLDQTQARDAMFSTDELFINTMRKGYCDTKDLNGIQWYLTSQSSSSQHVVSVFPNFWAAEVAGIRMRDWFAGAITDPDNVQDRAEEGDFVNAVPGVHPFPCEVASQ